MTNRQKGKHLTSVNFDRELYRKLRIIAVNLDKPISTCIIQAVEEFIKNNDKFFFAEKKNQK